MEKKHPDIDTFMEDDHDSCPRSSKVDDGNEKGDLQDAVTKAEEDDPTTDYSSKATTKTSMKDYLVQQQL
jgi:hypothetical protein